MEGTVRKIEMYYTTITTVDNQVVKIPNSLLTDNTITNVTSMDKRKLEIKVGVSYDTDLKKAKEILRQLLEEDPRAEEQDRQVTSTFPTPRGSRMDWPQVGQRK